MFLSNKTFNDNEPIYIQIEKYIKGIIPADLDDALNYSISAGVSYIRVSIEKGRINKNISKGSKH